MAPSTSTKLTYEDYQLLPDDGRRYEIIDGELYVNPSPATKHQIAVGNLHAIIWNYTRTRKTGTVFVAPFDVLLSDVDVLQPDVLYVSRQHDDRVTERNVTGAPDLVIEVLSESTRKTDETIKLKRYDRFGIGEYWIVDPVAESVRVYRRGRAGLELVDVGSTLTSPLLPDFQLDVADVFATTE